MKDSLKLQIKLAVPLLLVAGFFCVFIYYQLNRDSGNAVKSEILEDVAYKKLNGGKTNRAGENLLPFAVMIENHVEARPQSGLTQAKLVYEVLAEGEITRFLAFYDLSESVAEIGPVRSARPYYIDIAKEYGAVYVHCGGSPDAIDILQQDKSVYNLDEYPGYNTGYFYRDDQKTAPHNLFTSSELLTQAKNQYQLQDDSDFQSWKFKDSVSLGDGSKEVKINYSATNSSYQVAWKYLKESNKYERYQGADRHVTKDGEIIEADDVIIQYTDTQVLDEVGRKNVDLIGTGQAVIFRDGITMVGVWKKSDDSSRTIFYDENDNEVELNRGVIWVEVVPSYLEVEY